MNFNSIKYRILIVLGLGVLCFAVLLGRLCWIQLVRGDELSKMAAGKRVKDQILEPVRGNIYDRNHNELVTSVPVNSVVLDPSLIEDPEKEAPRIAALLGMNQDEVLIPWCWTRL